MSLTARSCAYWASFNAVDDCSIEIPVIAARAASAIATVMSVMRPPIPRVCFLICELIMLPLFVRSSPGENTRGAEANVSGDLDRGCSANPYNGPALVEVSIVDGSGYLGVGRAVELAENARSVGAHRAITEPETERNVGDPFTRSDRAQDRCLALRQLFHAAEPS